MKQAMTDDAKTVTHIETAHCNFLRDAMYFLYVDNRLADARYWFKIFVQNKYPGKRLLNARR